MKQKSLYERIADDIAAAIVDVLNKYKPELDKRKRSYDYLYSYIMDGTRKGFHLFKLRKGKTNEG